MVFERMTVVARVYLFLCLHLRFVKGTSGGITPSTLSKISHPPHPLDEIKPFTHPAQYGIPFLRLGLIKEQNAWAHPPVAILSRVEERLPPRAESTSCFHPHATNTTISVGFCQTSILCSSTLLTILYHCQCLLHSCA